MSVNYSWAIKVDSVIVLQDSSQSVYVMLESYQSEGTGVSARASFPLVRRFEVRRYKGDKTEMKSIYYYYVIFEKLMQIDFIVCKWRVCMTRTESVLITVQLNLNVFV